MLLRRTAEEADARHFVAAAWVLSVKPRTGGLLCTEAEREALLRENGIEEVVTVHFEEICALSCEEFVDRWLLGRMHVALAVCGEDFRFGRDRTGDALLLRELLRERGCDCLILPSLCAGGEPISSSRIRLLLQSGRPGEAAALLGRSFFIESEAIPGRGEGVKLGFPTANQPLPEGLLAPKPGVYATDVTLPDGQVFSALTDFGYHPTFGAANEPLFETYIPGYRGGALYGQRLRVAFRAYLREERRFPDEAALREQIAEDLRSL